MRGGWNIKSAVGKTGVRRQAGTEFNGEVSAMRVNLHRPGSASSIVQNIGAHGVGSIGYITNQTSLVAKGWEFQTVAYSPLCEFLKKATHWGSCDHLGDFTRIRLGYRSQNQGEGGEASKGE
jgi:hypothetical protein